MCPQTGDPLSVPSLHTPADVARLLREHGLAPRRAAGQNFVIDPNTVRRIVAAARLTPDDVVLEVGPGLGSLTLGLVGVVRRVVAVEVDAGFVEVLRTLFADEPAVEVVHADALRVDLAHLVGDGRARMVSNLPYNVATPIVMSALSCPAVDDLFVMVQREVGERWVARPGDPLRAAVSVKMELVADARVELRVPRTVFHPVPNVDSVMVRIVRRSDAPHADERGRVFALVERAFAQRRKILRNTLRGLADPSRLDRAASAAGIDLAHRAETVPADAFLALSRHLDAAG